MRRFPFVVITVIGLGLAGLSAQQFPEPGQVKQERARAELEVPYLVDLLRLKPGMTVADVGAGFGAHTVVLAKWIADGEVLATDIGQRQLTVIREYVAKEGNDRIILCERGIKTFETTTRYTLDLGSVAVLKEETHLPVIVDPSHAAGRRQLVLPFSRAAAAVGADGIIVEVHPRPEEALCDGPQQLPAAEFAQFADEIRHIAALMGREIG